MISGKKFMQEVKEGRECCSSKDPTLGPLTDPDIDWTRDCKMRDGFFALSPQGKNNYEAIFGKKKIKLYSGEIIVV